MVDKSYKTKIKPVISAPARILNFLLTFRKSFLAFLYRIYKKFTAILIHHPERSFFSLIGVLFILIIIGNLINRPPTIKSNPSVAPKIVTVYNVGSAPKINLIAKISKTGVINIVAQSGGIVQAIYKTEGDKVNRGDWIVWLSTNYQGGTLPTVTRQIAQKNLEFTETNYQTQKDMIVKQRDIADKVKGQTDALRNITNLSIADTEAAVSADQDVLNNLNSQIASLEAANTNHTNDTLILQAKQGIAGVLAGLSSLNTATRTAQYQGSSDNEPAKMAQTQHDLTIEQLDIQDKSIDLNREIARLNLLIAQISESLVYPTSPVTGTIERINVKIGDSVSPGTTIATITGDSITTQAEVSLPKEMADNVSRLEKSTLYINGKTLEIIPSYISHEATNGTLNTILYDIPDEFSKIVVNGSSITAEIPVGLVNTTSIIPYVPLDALFETQQEAYLFVVSTNGKNETIAQSRKVIPGQIYGDFVEIPKGLKNGDHIILDRSVIDGEKIKIKN
jgi:multidrug efflux pump subunit AcrA (membrane-fusion protein)